MTEFGTVLAMIAALSLTVTKVVDLIRNAADKGDTAPKWVWNVVALAVGVAFAVGWQINVMIAMVGLVPALVEHTSAVSGVAGEILSGVVIGLSAGFWHELLDSLSSVANRNNRVA